MWNAAEFTTVLNWIILRPRSFLPHHQAQPPANNTPPEPFFWAGGKGASRVPRHANRASGRFFFYSAARVIWFYAAFSTVWERFLRFLGKLFKLAIFFKGRSFLRVVQSENNYRVVVPEENPVYKCPYTTLPLWHGVYGRMSLWRMPSSGLRCRILLMRLRSSGVSRFNGTGVWIVLQ